MAGKENVWFQKIVQFAPLVIIAIILLITLGIILLCKEEKTSHEHTIDYTYCTNYKNERCYDMSPPSECICDLSFNLSEPLHGEVLLYYELDSFNQSNSDYQSSRDNNQLMGNLLEEPSESCEPYRYRNVSGKLVPIAPCGKIADTFFTDDYILEYVDKSNRTYHVPLISGVLSEQEKVGFGNPKNLSQLEIFAKPTGWEDGLSLVTLDSKNSDNNAFRNERLIGWMRTDWKRKPLARINQTEAPFEKGLEKGEYELIIAYTFHEAEPYKGPRKLILTSVMTQNTTNIYGAVSLSLAFVILGLTLILFILYHKNGKSNKDTKADESKEHQTPSELNPLRSTPTN